MTQIKADRILELSTSTGFGDIALAGAIVGYRTFSSVCADGDTFEYFAEAIDTNGAATGDWETGLATWHTGNIMTRTGIYSSSNAGVAVIWTSGTKRIALSIVSETMNTIDENFAAMAVSLIDLQTLVITNIN